MSNTRLTRGSGAHERDTTLTEVKLALVAARERGDRDALAHALREHPTYADALTEFDLGLVATSSYTIEGDMPDVLEVAQRAQSRAFATVFGAASVAPAALSLKALRQASGRSLAALADGLGLGLDVLSALESGRIRVASV
ncbi:MAG TPA: helix-turn-helix transcriptional regulator, partial [Ktedonobacterales bacterium]